MANPHNKQRLEAKLSRLPPVICRFLAKGPDGLLASDRCLMERTGWGKTRLRRIYGSASWAGITVGEVDAYLEACGLSWSSQRRERWLLQLNADDITRMRHLRAATGWRASMVQRHIDRLRKALA